MAIALAPPLLWPRLVAAGPRQVAGVLATAPCGPLEWAALDALLMFQP